MTAINRIEEHIIKYEYEHDDNSGYCSVNSERADSPTGSNSVLHIGSRNSTSTSMQHDTKPRLSRREIANSNERKRMQSINAGFESLRHLLPHKQGEKLSKATILQQTAEYIYQLEQERAILLSQNSQLKRLIGQQESEMTCMSPPHTPVTHTAAPTSINKKRKIDIEETQINDEISDLMIQLDRERALRKHLEEKVEKLEGMYPTEKPTDVTEQVTLQYDPSKIEEEESQDVILKLAEDETVVIQPVESTPSTVIHESPILQAAITNTPSSKVIKVETDTSKRPDTPVTSESPSHNTEQIMPSARVYLASTSRQNLETIVEAIRHLEGDNLFGDCMAASTSSNTSQDVPLALTKHNSTQRLLNPFLQFHNNQPNSSNNNSSQSQQRPGVIVVKQQT